MLFFRNREISFSRNLYRHGPSTTALYAHFIVRMSLTWDTPTCASRTNEFLLSLTIIIIIIIIIVIVFYRLHARNWKIEKHGYARTDTIVVGVFRRLFFDGRVLRENRHDVFLFGSKFLTNKTCFAAYTIPTVCDDNGTLVGKAEKLPKTNIFENRLTSCAGHEETMLP